MGENRPSGDGPPTDHAQRLTIPDAARALGVSSEAVRGRVKRGTLESERSADGTVYVLLDVGTTPRPNADQAATDHRPTADQPRDQSEVVEELRSRVRSLEHQLEEANTRDRENRRLLAAALNARQIEAPEGEKNPEPEFAPDTGVSQDEPRTRSWWKKMFGRH